MGYLWLHDAPAPLEPPVPPDGSCVGCGKPRRVDQSALYRTHAERDPFCSAKCARAWYGCQLADVRDDQGSKRAAQLAAARFRASRPFRAA